MGQDIFNADASMPSSAWSAELMFAWRAAAFLVPAEEHAWDRLVPLPPFPEEL